MGKYFNVDVVPDCIAGDVSENNGTDDVANGDIIFNWTAVDVPKGGCLLRSISAVVNAEDGAYASGSLVDYELIFAKSINGTAPSSLGAINAAQTVAIDHDHYIGSLRLESTTAVATLTKTAFNVIYMPCSHFIGNAVSGGSYVPIVIYLEYIS